ncbi:MAG: CAAX geranylgeranyltransferase alpha subunit [Vezdaea aestivalis]|nr:MAG: CAAX geranylgeranyltransferase alpha subunit [Vezdaea aestivalis]
MPPNLSYSNDPLWADVVPIPQDDGGPNALATIAYSDEYSEATSYLRAVMAADEHSERGLALTAHLVSLNPSHYTVWLFRAATLFALDKDLREEIAWLNEIALIHLKNYQIWHHRQLLMDRLGDPSGEAAFIRAMFDEDAKNYHVWSYRAWLVRRFELWDSELPDIERLLREDVQNNSAWNHRYYCVFGRGERVGHEPKVAPQIVEREISFATEKIELAPQNLSPWNYLRGILRAGDLPLATVKSVALKYAPVEEPDKIRSSHALDFLADIYAGEKDGAEHAVKALDLLTEKYDPIRANYWNYRKSLLVKSAA